MKNIYALIFAMMLLILGACDSHKKLTQTGEINSAKSESVDIGDSLLQAFQRTCYQRTKTRELEQLQNCVDILKIDSSHLKEDLKSIAFHIHMIASSLCELINDTKAPRPNDFEAIKEHISNAHRLLDRHENFKTFCGQPCMNKLGPHTQIATTSIQYLIESLGSSSSTLLSDTTTKLSYILRRLGWH